MITYIYVLQHINEVKTNTTCDLPVHPVPRTVAPNLCLHQRLGRLAPAGTLTRDEQCRPNE